MVGTSLGSFAHPTHSAWFAHDTIPVIAVHVH